MNHDQSNHNVLDYFSCFQTLTTEFIQSLPTRKVGQLNPPIPDSPLPDVGMSKDQAVSILTRDIAPFLSASRGGRYWGFVTGGSTPAATFADWLVSTYDQNVCKSGDSIASLIEQQTLQWLTELFYLPNTFKGIITTGATSANFLAAINARQSIGLDQGIDSAKEGVSGLSLDVFSACPHASMIKGLGFAGLGQNCVIRIPTLEQSEAMDVTALEAHLSKSEARGKLVIASAGTVTGTNFDDLKSIVSLCQQHRAWLHVDAAFGVFERLINQDRGASQGLEFADSITLDCHKWLNVPYDSGVFLTRHAKTLFASCDVAAPYLQSDDHATDFLSLGIENSRRFRALPIWFSLLSYGRSGVRHWVEKNIEQASRLADWISQNPDWELIGECTLNVVLFRPNCQTLSREQANELTNKALSLINEDGRLFLSPGQWLQDTCIRAALCNWQTSKQDLEIAKSCLTDVSAQL